MREGMWWWWCCWFNKGREGRREALCVSQAGLGGHGQGREGGVGERGYANTCACPHEPGTLCNPSPGINEA